jgi:hypothetical protein
MVEPLFAEADLWVVVRVLDRHPMNESRLRIREAIAYGRRTVLLSGEVGRLITLDVADAVVLRADLRAARPSFSPSDQLAIDRAVRQLE